MKVFVGRTVGTANSLYARPGKCFLFTKFRGRMYHGQADMEVNTIVQPTNALQISCQHSGPIVVQNSLTMWNMFFSILFFTFPFQPLIYRAPKNDLCLLVSSKVKSRGVDLCKLARVMGHHRRCQVATSRLSLPLCIFPCIYPCICSCIYPCICLKFQDIFVSNF